MNRSMLALVLLGSLATALGCQGDVAPPALDNRNDPALGTLPPTPTIIAVEPDSVPCRVRVRWSVASEEGLAEYQVFRAATAGENPGELILHVVRGTHEIFDDTDIQAGTTYTYRVRSVTTDGRLGLRSDAAAATATCSAAGHPTPPSPVTQSRSRSSSSSSSSPR